MSLKIRVALPNRVRSVWALSRLSFVKTKIFLSLIGNVNCKLMYSQSLTVTKQLPELEASLEVSFGLPNFELSIAIVAASGT